MLFGNRIVDHFVLCVRDLAEAVNRFDIDYGVKAHLGGRHLTQGTHNAIIKIGDQIYLEILAPDPENLDHKGSRWMGIDLITNIPIITRWCLNTPYLIEDSKTLKKKIRI